MDVFTMVVIIVALGIGAGVITSYFKYRAEAQRMAADSNAPRLQALEDRIRVLERVVTDSNLGLKQELDRLEKDGRS